MNGVQFESALATAVFGEGSVPQEPSSATGVYPGPVWADAQAWTLADEEIAEPPSATGVYPGPVWADAQAWTLADEEVAAPPSPTGVYPGPVWADSQGFAASSSRALDAAPAPPDTRGANGGESRVAAPAAAAELWSLKDVEYQAELDAASEPEQTTAQAGDLALDFREMFHIIRVVAEADSGSAAYAAVSADREFTTPGQDAYQRRRFGLGFGLLLYTQQSGLLGGLLRIMQRRDAEQFAAAFAPHSDELVAVTTAATEDGRLGPVGGQPLTSPAWLDRFRLASASPTFVAAQNEAAIELLFRPMLRVALELGADTDRTLAMVFDRVVVRGLGGGLRWVMHAAGPLRTAEMRTHALRTLGYESLAAFQRNTGWTPQDGQFGPQTHAALVGALRRQGLVPVPTAADIAARMVAAAQGTARQRLLRLRDADAFEDVRYRNDL